MLHKFFILMGLILASLLPAKAQIFEYIDMDNGLGSRRVLSIEQGKQYYIWVLTHKGIDRYDGKRFTHYNLFRKEKALNFYPNLNTLHTDSDGTVYEIGKDGFLFRYDERKDSFQLVFDLKQRFPEFKKRPISAIYMDDANRTWFCIDQYIFLYDIAKNQVHQFTHPLKGKITSITQTHDDTIYYLAAERNLYKVSLKGNQMEKAEQIDLPSLQLIDYIYYHQPSKMLVINNLLDELFIYDPQERKLTSMGESMKDIGINTIISDRLHPDTLYIATDGKGIYRLDMKRQHLAPFLREDPHTPNKMNGNIIKDIYQDQSGRLWIVVYPTGITVYSEQYPSYKWVKHSPNNPHSLANNCINGILEDTEGDIWYATNNGVSCYKKDKDQWINFLTDDTNTINESENRIFSSLCEVKPGVILAGGYMSGIYMINKHTKETTFYQQHSVTPDKSPDKYIRCIYRDEDGLVWTGGFYRLKAYNPRTGLTTEYNIGYPVTTIHQRNKQSLWIGTINGIYVFNKTNHTFQPIENDQMGCINVVYTDSAHHTYIGTYGNGLFILPQGKTTFTHYHTENSGIGSDNIYSITPGRNGNFYIGTENGLSFFDRTHKTFTNWTKEQGLLAASFNPNAAIHTRDGLLIFGSNEGAIILPDDIRLPTEFYSHIVLSNLKIMYRTVHPGGKDSPLSLPIDQTGLIKLRYDQNTFSLNVSSINFDNPSDIAYSWILEGFYDHWSPLASDGLIQYTNLSPGNYTLRVRAILTDSHQLVEERSIRILIGRPAWLTFWAFLGYALIIIGIAWIIIRIKIIRHEKQVSQEKINFFIHTAHDIRTPLTLIKAPLGEILKNEPLSEKGVRNLNLALQSTENLSDLADNLINFQKESYYSSQAKVSHCELNAYLQAYLKQFEAYAEQKGITLHYTGTPQKLEAWIDRNKMDSILRNLISNALKYTPHGGEIQITAGSAKNRWTLNIEDTGIGIPKEDQKKMFRFLFRGENATNQLITGSGIGMLLTYRLIRNHEGRISYTSTEGVGTTFALSFPIRSERYRYQAGNIPDGILSEEEQVERIWTDVPCTISKQTVLDAPLILIVEDNVGLRTFLAESLADTYRTEEAGNGQEALDKISITPPDLVISDVMMPVMDGEKMCGILKSNIETSHIPIILLTALGTREDILRGLQTKADMYIVKPFDLTVLKANISNLLENRELIRKKLQQASIKTDPPAEDIPLPSELDDEFIRRVTFSVKENLGGDFTVDTLCAEMNMSRTGFYNKIKALTGIPPNEFIRNIRMQEAAILLKSQRYTVAEVSDRMGFADPKYFADAFKKFYGVPPSVYKKNE